MTTRVSDFVAYFVTMAMSLRVAIDAWGDGALLASGFFGLCAITWCWGMYEKAFDRPQIEAGE